MTVNDFSTIEVRMLQQLAPKMPIDEIASIMDKPIAQVKLAMESFCAHIVSYDELQKEKEVRKQKRKLLKKRQKELTRLNNEQEKKRTVVFHSSHVSKPQDDKVFDTKQVDYHSKILVRIDSKTQVYVEPGTDIEAFKRTYLAKIQQSRDFSLARNSDTKVVKKFKPTE